jgi:hypothetical protein
MTNGIHTSNIPSHVLNKAVRYELDTVIDEEGNWFMRKWPISRGRLETKMRVIDLLHHNPSKSTKYPWATAGIHNILNWYSDFTVILNTMYTFERMFVRHMKPDKSVLIWLWLKNSDDKKYFIQQASGKFSFTWSGIVASRLKNSRNIPRCVGIFLTPPIYSQ